MKRRKFLELGAAAGAASLIPGLGAGTPAFRARHVIAIVLGGGVRRRDVVGNAALTPSLSELQREGTLFTHDYGDTTHLDGYMVSEILTGRADARSQRPSYPTWSEYVRKKTGAKALELWMLQPLAYHGGWTWDIKNHSTHPGYGARFGATNLTVARFFADFFADFFEDPRRWSAPELVDRFIDPALGHTTRERRLLTEWIDAVLATERSTPVGNAVERGDALALQLVFDVLTSFKPRLITIQILGLSGGNSNLAPYLAHLGTVDRLIGRLWRAIQSEPYFRETTALVIRPDGSRDARLGRRAGDPDAHHAFTILAGPGFRKGHVVPAPVHRCDLAPTLTYLLTGEDAEHASGCVRLEAFETHSSSS